MSERRVIAEVEELDDVEVVDGEPVLSEAEPVDPSAALAERGPLRALAQRPGLQVAVQAAAVAATGVVAGAVGAAVVRKAGKRVGARRKDATGPLEVVSTRTYLVRVHELAPKGE